MVDDLISNNVAGYLRHGEEDFAKTFGRKPTEHEKAIYAWQVAKAALRDLERELIAIEGQKTVLCLRLERELIAIEEQKPVLYLRIDRAAKDVALRQQERDAAALKTLPVAHLTDLQKKMATLIAHKFG